MSDPEQTKRINALHEGTPEERISAWLNLSKDDHGHFQSGDWMTALVPYISYVSYDVSTSHPSVTFAYTVQPDHCNRFMNLHGGCAATLFDYLTTIPIALINRPGFWRFMGVSRTLNVTYLRPVPSGTETLVVAEILQIGKKMATIKGTMKRRSDGVILAVCEHGKFNVDPEEKL